MTRMGLIYQHATEDRDRAIADTLDRMIQGGADRLLGTKSRSGWSRERRRASPTVR